MHRLLEKYHSLAFTADDYINMIATEPGYMVKITDGICTIRKDDLSLSFTLKDTNLFEAIMTAGFQTEDKDHLNFAAELVNLYSNKSESIADTVIREILNEITYEEAEITLPYDAPFCRYIHNDIIFDILSDLGYEFRPSEDNIYIEYISDGKAVLEVTEYCNHDLYTSIMLSLMYGDIPKKSRLLAGKILDELDSFLAEKIYRKAMKTLEKWSPENHKIIADFNLEDKLTLMLIDIIIYDSIKEGNSALLTAFKDAILDTVSIEED